MGKKLYVGNLPFSATDQILSDAFAQCGTVESARIIIDRDTGRLLWQASPATAAPGDAPAAAAPAAPAAEAEPVRRAPVAGGSPTTSAR